MSEVATYEAVGTAPAAASIPSLEGVKAQIKALEDKFAQDVAALREGQKPAFKALELEHREMLKKAKAGSRDVVNGQIKEMRKALTKAAKPWKQLLAGLEPKQAPAPVAPVDPVAAAAEVSG